MSVRTKHWARAMPAEVYTLSLRPYPARREDPAYASDFELRRVRSNGEIIWQGELISIAQPLAGGVIGLREDDDGNAEVYFGPVPLSNIDGITLKFESCARPSRARRPRASCPQGPQPVESH